MQTHAADPLRVLVVDDDRVFAELVTALLSTEECIEVIGCARDGAEAVARAECLQPDVVLMDVNMPVLDGLEATRRIAAALPRTRVVVLTGSTSAHAADDARTAGAAGFVTKDRIADELVGRVLDTVRVCGGFARAGHVPASSLGR